MNRKKAVVTAVMALVCAMVFMPLSADAQKSPKGAKAIFDSGDGASVRMSPAARPRARLPQPAPEKYVGISYKLALLEAQRGFLHRPRSRTFKSGERIKMLVRTNPARLPHDHEHRPHREHHRPV